MRLQQSLNKSKEVFDETSTAHFYDFLDVSSNEKNV